MCRWRASPIDQLAVRVDSGLIQLPLPRTAAPVDAFVRQALQRTCRPAGVQRTVGLASASRWRAARTCLTTGADAGVNMLPRPVVAARQAEQVHRGVSSGASAADGVASSMQQPLEPARCAPPPARYRRRRCRRVFGGIGNVRYLQTSLYSRDAASAISWPSPRTTVRLPPTPPRHGGVCRLAVPEVAPRSPTSGRRSMVSLFGRSGRMSTRHTGLYRPSEA